MPEREKKHFPSGYAAAISQMQIPSMDDRSEREAIEDEMNAHPGPKPDVLAECIPGPFCTDWMIDGLTRDMDVAAGIFAPRRHRFSRYYYERRLLADLFDVRKGERAIDEAAEKGRKLRALAEQNPQEAFSYVPLWRGCEYRPADFKRLDRPGTILELAPVSQTESLPVAGNFPGV